MKEVIGFLVVAGVWFSCIAAWITAIVHTVTNDMIAMLIVDLMIPPVGVIHGYIIWFS